jgi:tRNA threonylcarbamoyladenosine biosynthesis protein TsaB
VGAIMIILAIDTATDAVSVALHDGESVVASSEIRSERQHAEALTPMIDFVCKQANLSLFDVGAVAVDIGPGLFTGMRVGIASAQAIAQVLELPMAAITSLDAIATEVPSTLDVVASIIDARRGEVYWSLYRMRGVGVEPLRLTEPVVSSPEDMAVHLADRGEDITCVGTGFIRHAALFEDVPWAMMAGEPHAFPTAQKVVVLASHRIAVDDTVQAGEIMPMYLRAPDAEINWLTREAAQ